MSRPCANCDVVDDGPRLQYAEGDRVLLFHYDCTPKYIRDDHPLPAYAAADSGKRGAELVGVIDKHNAKLAKES